MRTLHKITAVLHRSFGWNWSANFLVSVELECQLFCENGTGVPCSTWQATTINWSWLRLFCRWNWSAELECQANVAVQFLCEYEWFLIWCGVWSCRVPLPFFVFHEGHEKPKLHNQKTFANPNQASATSLCRRPSSWVAGILYTFTHISIAALAPLTIHTSAHPKFALIHKRVYRQTHTHTYIYTYIYICIYKERERERDRKLSQT